MNAKELRIGNFVKIRYAPFEGRPSFFQSESIKARGINACELYPNNYQPIEISREWLKRFGFITDGIHWYTESKRFELIDCSLGELTDLKYNGNSDTPLKYVHELQNLYFALTSEELTFCKTQ